MGLWNRFFGRQEDEKSEDMASYEAEPASGWLAIDKALEYFYPEGGERHYGTLVKYEFGGEDPLDGFNIYDNDEQAFHRHIISYGMSDLYDNPEARENDLSKWGCEFTMRVIPYQGDGAAEAANGRKVEHEPYWVMNLMQNLARYVFQTGNRFDAYHFVPTNSPIRTGSDTKLVGIAFVPDARLESITTSNGQVQFLQLIGLTQKELDWLWQEPTTSRVKELIDKMRADNPMLLVDLERQKDYVE